MPTHRSRLATWLPLALALLAWRGASGIAAAQPTGDAVSIPRREPLQVKGSVRVEPGVHTRSPRSLPGGGPAAVVFVDGVHDAIVDLSGVTLVNTTADAPQDEHVGFAIYLTDCVNVTVRGGVLRGFKGGVVAERCRGLKLEKLSFDRNFAQKLLSTAVAEDPSDWLAPHDNDGGEWLEQYGAAISLLRCDDAVVSGCRARHGQNGLLLTRCSQASVFDNDFSFLSGWGIALYRSSRNVLAHNRCDYCVRGYSNEAYARGQDSAGILLFERSSDNVIAENSARCCGDGVFLFAGRDLVDGRAAQRGEQAAGGCDRNLIYRNDVSCAVANGVEVTFSRENRVVENVADNCLQHGLWGGYSSRLVVTENSFAGSIEGGVTIEHGQECWIARNVFERCGAGIELYWDEDPQFVGGPFGASHDTSSRDHWLIGNSFADNLADLRVRATTGLQFAGNVYSPDLEKRLFVSGLAAAPGEPRVADPREWLQGIGEFLPSGSLIDTTLRSPPTEFPADFVASERVEGLELPGATRPANLGVGGVRGIDTIQMGEWGPWDFESGEPRPSPRPVSGLFSGARWKTAWISWKDGADPRAMGAETWRALVEQTAVMRAEVDELSDPWANRDDVRSAVGETQMGLVATTSVRLRGGRYSLRVLSDDGVRVRIDGRLAIDNWTWHSATQDQARFEVEAGEHEFSVEYFQVDGGAALSVDLLAQ